MKILNAGLIPMLYILLHQVWVLTECNVVLKVFIKCRISREDKYLFYLFIFIFRVHRTLGLNLPCMLRTVFWF